MNGEYDAIQGGVYKFEEQTAQITTWQIQILIVVMIANLSEVEQPPFATAILHSVHAPPPVANFLSQPQPFSAAFAALEPEPPVGPWPLPVRS